jgi:hypothetical protein
MMELYVRRSILAAVYIDGASPPLALMCRTSLSAKVPLRENGFDFFSLKLLWLLFIARPLDLDCGIGGKPFRTIRGPERHADLFARQQLSLQS